MVTDAPAGEVLAASYSAAMDAASAKRIKTRVSRPDT
jgi:hypothetical protein